MKRALIILLTLAAAAAPANAQPKGDMVEQAKQFFEAGRQAYEAGQYAVAIAAFEEAYRLSPRPPVLFSLAQSYRRQYFVDSDPAKLKRAIDLYQQYLKDVPTGGRRDDAVQYISELSPILARVEDEQKKAGKGPVEAMMPKTTETTQLLISSPRTKGVLAVVSIDGDKPTEAPRLAEVTAKNHKIRVEAPGFFPEETDATAVEGRLVPIQVNLKEMPAKLTVKSAGGVEIALDGRPTGGHAGKPFDAPGGKHFLTVSQRGHRPFGREIMLKRGEPFSVDAPLEKTGQRVASYYVLGAAAVALLAGGATTTLAFVHDGNAQAILDKRDKDMRQLTQDELDTYNRERTARDDYRTTSYFLYGGAAAIAVTGALLYFIDQPRVESAPGMMGGAGGDAGGGGDSGVAPMVGASTIGLSWHSQF